MKKHSQMCETHPDTGEYMGETTPVICPFCNYPFHMPNEEGLHNECPQCKQRFYLEQEAGYQSAAVFVWERENHA